MKSVPRSSSGLAAAFLVVASAAAAQSWGTKVAAGDAVFSALEAELARSMQRLRQESFGPPYFLAYRLHDVRHFETVASLGAVVSEDFDEFRAAYVEARFGDSNFDNTDLSYQGVNGAASADPQVLRHTYWLLTDQAYRGAVSGWLEKKAKRSTELFVDELDDFSSATPQRRIERFPAPNVDRGRLRALAQRLSRVFRDYPTILDSNATVGGWWTRRILLTSEGTRLLTHGEEMPHEIRLNAMTRADDGMRLEDGFYEPVRSWSDLPSDKKLELRVRELATELIALRAAPVQDAEAAPAILDPEMSGVLFHEALGHKLEGQRQRDPHESQVFRDLVGKSIIPEFLSMYDDPTLKSFHGSPLHGSYDFDAEGAPARRVTLVEHGILRGFLMSRWPIKGFPETNGHGRSDARSHATGRMANLIVTADGAVSRDQLERQLLELVRRQGKDHGFLLVGSNGGENPTNRESAQTLEVRPRLVYRLDLKGKRTLVRGVKLVGTPLVVLNRIIAAGDDQTLANGFQCGAESGWVPVSQIAPSLLISQVELQRLPEDRARPPVLPSPLEGRR